MVSVPRLWVTRTVAVGIVLPGSVTLCEDALKDTPAATSSGVMVWLELVPEELKGMGVDEVGSVKVPVPDEVKVMGLSLLALFERVGQHDVRRVDVDDVVGRAVGQSADRGTAGADAVDNGLSGV